MNPLGRRGLALLALLLFSLLTISCSEDPASPTATAASEQEAELISPPVRTLPPTNTPISRITAAIQATSTFTPSIAQTHSPSPSQTSIPQIGACATPGRIVSGSFPSRIDGPDRAYRIYLPPCYGEDGRSYPALYLFHGGAQSDDHWDNLGVGVAAEELISSGVIPPLLIIMPDGGELANNSSGGPGSFEGLILDNLVPFIESNFCAWSEPQGRAVGGISRGGYWALEIAFRHPDLFSSVGGHSAALLDTDAGPDMNPQDTALSNDLDGLRIYFDIGDRDYLINEISKLHEDMSIAGIKHHWTLNEGQHEDAYWRQHLAEYLEWYSQPWPAERLLYPICVTGIEDSLE